MNKTDYKIFAYNGFEILANRTPDGIGWRIDVIVFEEYQSNFLAFPTELEGAPVVEINEFRVDDDCGVKVRVEIPEGAEIIQSGAFKDCSALTSVVIPASVKTIAGNAFSKCRSLRRFEVAEKNPNYRSIDGALLTKDGKTLLKGVVRDDGYAVIPDGVEKINKGAFHHCDSLKSAVIPQGVREIDDSVFYECKSLEYVDIPTSVERIGAYAFAFCLKLTSAEIPANVVRIEERAFTDAESLTNVVIHNGVKQIGFRAFHGAENVKKIVIPSSVEEIDSGAFGVIPVLAQFDVAANNPRYCGVAGALLSRDGRVLVMGVVDDDGAAVIPDGVEEIGECAFGYCRSLKRVEFPASVKIIGNNAFCGCVSLTKAVVPSSIEIIGPNAFRSCCLLTTVEISDGVKEIGARAFLDCRSLTQAAVPSSVEKIGAWAIPNHKSASIYGVRGSTAEKFAKENKIRFEPLDAK